MIAHIQFLSGGLTALVRVLLITVYRVLFSFIAYHVACQIIDDEAGWF